MVSVENLIRYRLQHERVVERYAEGCINTVFGEFRSIAYSTSVDTETHVALVHGDVGGPEAVAVRMHANCTFGDVFASTDCDCYDMIAGSLKKIAAEGRGVLVYLHQSSPSLRYQREGNRQKLIPHLRGADYQASTDGQRKLQHESGIGAQILADLGLRNVRLLTNHPRKIIGLEAYGIQVVSQEPVEL